jgi:aminoglycoside phosphotransferase (APT) family kinase protein
VSPSPPPESLTRSSRDPDALRQQLDGWLSDQLPDQRATVLTVDVPESNGMSSETLLFDASWIDTAPGMDTGPIAGAPRTRRLVARVAPDTGDVPVFPSYDLAAQFAVIGLVAAHSDVPVPRTHWLESDPSVLGAPFFVMDRVDGRVPPDVMPYTFEGWLLDESPDGQRALQDATVSTLARLHAIDLEAVARAGTDVGFLDYPGVTGASALRRHVEHWRTYHDWMSNGRRFPLIEAAFAWLEDHWPSDDGGDAVLSWGDARIGNVIYEGLAPAAVLDWEMAGIAPPGVDLGWMVFLHTFFQDLATQFELPGLPQLFRPEDVVSTYTAAGGAEVGDITFHVVYAALRHALVMARVHDRRVHFGEAEPADDPDDAIMHRVRLERLLTGEPVTTPLDR